MIYAHNIISYIASAHAEYSAPLRTILLFLLIIPWEVEEIGLKLWWKKTRIAY